ncbi:MAG TPA: hypothetical protein VM427_03975 [Patescibacteria group bacterium]|nr:hypothetical protein [Patescibacteria group bacterium]
MIGELRDGMPNPEHTRIAYLHAAKGIDAATDSIAEAGSASE